MPSCHNHHSVRFAALGILTVLLLLADVMFGSVSLSAAEVWGALWHPESMPVTTVHIVWQIRVIKAAVALLAGMALSVSGAQMQTLFRNPLAGPYVLGISAGASLGVALMLLGSSWMGGEVAAQVMHSSLSIAGAALIGAAAVLVLVVAVSARIKDIMMILILGVMFSSAVSSIVQILQYVSQEDALKTFVVWTMGSLGEVTSSQLPVLTAAVVIGLLLALFTIKPLDMLLLGEAYARSMGLEMRRSRMVILTSTTLLVGSVTAFCGPISFIGLAMPHVARSLMRTASHSVLLPASALVGASTLLACDLVARLCAIPINSVTSLVGIPIVIWVVLRGSISNSY
jgi:iron complex transport system permease protein